MILGLHLIFQTTQFVIAEGKVLLSHERIGRT